MGGSGDPPTTSHPFYRGIGFQPVMLLNTPTILAGHDRLEAYPTQANRASTSGGVVALCETWLRWAFIQFAGRVVERDPQIGLLPELSKVILHNHVAPLLEGVFTNSLHDFIQRACTRLMAS